MRLSVISQSFVSSKKLNAWSKSKRPCGQIWHKLDKWNPEKSILGPGQGIGPSDFVRSLRALMSINLFERSFALEIIKHCPWDVCKQNTAADRVLVLLTMTSTNCLFYWAQFCLRTCMQQSSSRRMWEQNMAFNILFNFPCSCLMTFALVGRAD